MSNYVLDASAVLALLQNEPGAARVQEVLRDSVISSVNVCEVIGKLVDAGMSPDDAATSFELLNLPVADFDTRLAYDAGTLITRTKKAGLSLGDRACLALGLKLKNSVVTTERLWSRLKMNVAIEVIR